MLHKVSYCRNKFTENPNTNFSNKISLAFSMHTMSYHTIIKNKTIINMKMYINITQSHLHTNETINIYQKMKNQLKTDRWLD